MRTYKTTFISNGSGLLIVEFRSLYDELNISASIGTQPHGQTVLWSKKTIIEIIRFVYMKLYGESVRGLLAKVR